MSSGMTETEGIPSRLYAISVESEMGLKLAN